MSYYYNFYGQVELSSLSYYWHYCQGAGKTAAWVRVSIVQKKDLSSNPSTHIKRWDVPLTLELCGPRHTQTQTCAPSTHRHNTQWCMHMYADMHKHAWSHTAENAPGNQRLILKNRNSSIRSVSSDTLNRSGICVILRFMLQSGIRMHKTPDATGEGASTSQQQTTLIEGVGLLKALSDLMQAPSTFRCD